MAWPEHRVVVEFDGDVHRERAVFVRDLRRQNGIMLAGWQLLRFTSADVLGRPNAVLSTVGTALGLTCPQPSATKWWPSGADRHHFAALGVPTGRISVAGTLVGVPRVVGDVVLKPEISDPQGQAVLGALGRLGHEGVRSVRQGKHFVLEVDGTL